MSIPGLLVSQFSAVSGPSAAMLRWLQGNAHIEHVDFVIPRAVINVYGLGVPKIATPEGLLGARLQGGVQLRPSDYAKFTRAIRLGCVVPDIDAAYEWAFSQIGKPYDKGAILDFFLHRRRAFNFSQPAWFCDCFNYAGYWKGGVKLLDCDNPNILTPQEERLSPTLHEQMASLDVVSK